jgi:hypothetical protein
VKKIDPAKDLYGICDKEIVIRRIEHTEQLIEEKRVTLIQSKLITGRRTIAAFKEVFRPIPSRFPPAGFAVERTKVFVYEGDVLGPFDEPRPSGS